MNATQDASNEMQNDINKKLISFNDKQNDLIFATRKRLFDLEKIQKRDCIFLISMNFLICFACILICVKLRGLTW